MKNNMLSNDFYNKISAYWRATNYLSVGQLYLISNPLLRRPLSMSDIKPRLVGHWGTVPGQNFIYAHLNRIIKQYDLNMIYISGPGHGGNAMIANDYLDGTYTEFYPSITEDEKGMQKLFKQFSFPGGVSSHVAPEVPGSINEGGELGYSLAHAYGAVLDNPNLIAACVIGDGEAETGPLAASWHINKFISPKTDGVVLPILHLNGYKIANPTMFGRMNNSELYNFFVGCGYLPFIVEGHDENTLHVSMAETLDIVMEEINNIKKGASKDNIRWPVIVFKSLKGWTGPKEAEGNFRSHQIPLIVDSEHPENLSKLEAWLKSYKPEELFDENGKLIEELRDLTPKGNSRMGANPYSNGGLLLKELNLPDFRNYKIDITKPGSVIKSDMTELGNYLRDVIKLNPNFKIFSPDETLSNRLNHVFEVTNRKWNETIVDTDQYLSPEGQVIDSLLSEHVCEGMLEGYILTGRHGIFTTYEAFSRIIDSMVSQHAKWLKISNNLSWRRDISSLNILLTSHCWQQDHNGFTHQDPGFLNHVVTKKASIVRVYLPYDANSLISCVDHSIKSKNYINVIVASKQPRCQWLNMDQTVKHCTNGIGIWDFASNDNGNPDVVFACAGDTPTLESLAAVSILKKYIPDLKIRFINVVDLMKLQSSEEHPHGLADAAYDYLFTKDKPIIFNFHGYPNLIHELTYKRENKNLHVHGYIEEGTITTSFDMRVQNRTDRYHLILNLLKYIDIEEKSMLKDYCNKMLDKHSKYIIEYGVDIPEVVEWKWD